MHDEPVAAVVRRLEVELHTAGHGRALLATDGDGTLWTGDVGDALFEDALARGHIGERAHAALIAEAECYGFDARGDAPTVARTLDAAHRAGTYPEDRAYAMMAWCMAGMREEDLRSEARDLLAGAFGIAGRLIAESMAILTWAGTRRVPVLLVSASPRAIVREAAAVIGGRTGATIEVRSMTPVVADGVIEPAIDGPIVYGEGKVTALEAERGDRTLLAALGDSGFDGPMLRRARLPIAIRPKASLLALDLPGIVHAR